MKRSPIKKQSDKQKDELKLRRWMRYTLWVDQEARCKKCDGILTYAHSELSHKKPLARGGKTTRENCEILCAECHSNKEHNLRNTYNEQPMWSKKGV